MFLERARQRGASAGVLAAFLIFLTALPAAADTLIQPGQHHFHFVRVFRDGVEVEFYGEIRTGATQELQAVLAANPQAKVIHLNSEGGSVLEGRRLSVLIREKGLITVSDTFCYSACVLAFLGAEQRYVSADAELGLHRESAEHASAAEVAASEKIDEDFMADLGIRADFIKKAFATPSSGLWIPTTRELIDAKVITGVRGDFAMTGYSGKTADDQVDSMMGANRMMKALKAADPQRYSTVRSGYIAALQHNVSYDEFAAFAEANENAVVGDYLIKAGDPLLREFAKASVDLMRRAVAKNPAGCRLASDGTDGFNLHIEPGGGVDFTSLSEIAARAVADGALHNTPAPGREIVDASRAALRLAFRARHADEVKIVADLGAAGLKPGVACTALADYLETSFSLPASEEMAFLRYNYANEPSTAPVPQAAAVVGGQQPRPHGNKHSD